ncbi:putative E4 SUMO-protein ligase PIAL2 [Cocos nucifera]|uniref:Putative E4 SUMO-protein ligase PIAL2 n=1 Tax=Cocos nucifera TaxID=13894 RepID=A0A8K0I3F1_COCNU|nr:putative E4 SUMO-protein ligase PIAL2 [Cocos nucifera]
MQVATAVEANAARLEAVAKRLAMYINGATRVTPFELFRLYFALARGIDYALSSNDIPGIAHCLPPLIKQENRMSFLSNIWNS